MTLRATLLLLALAGTITAAVTQIRRSEPADPPTERSFQKAVQEAVVVAQEHLVASTDLFEDHSSWEDPWIVATTHYEVRTVHSRNLAFEVSNGLETMRSYFVQLLGEGDPTGQGKIYILPDRPAYNAFGDQYGAHHSSILGSFYTEDHRDRPVATYLDDVRMRTQMWITHGAVHQFLAGRSGSGLPVWIEEGLASYFSLFWDFSYGVRELEAMRAADRLVPFEQLRSEDLTAYPSDPHARFIQLGMLFTYLLRHREDTRIIEGEGESLAPFDEYLRALASGRSVEGLPFTAYLEDQGEAIEREFLAFRFE